MKQKPVIGISIGDIAGIGPELADKILLDQEILSLCTLKIISTVDYTSLEKLGIQKGFTQKESGKIAFESFIKAINLAKEGKIDAIVTAPINKKALHLAGYKYNGHTEILAKETNTPNYAMLFHSNLLNVILSTIHCPLEKVPKLITQKKLTQIIKLGYKAMKDLGIGKPRIGIAGLNPHAGEDGCLGLEEKNIIIPVVKNLEKTEMDIKGPFPADVIFRPVSRKDFDLIVAQYHDQGLIPLKMLSFDHAVNITLGTPIIRTSPDHGTAYDIVDKNLASNRSMSQAIKIAVKLIRNKK